MGLRMGGGTAPAGGGGDPGAGGGGDGGGADGGGGGGLERVPGGGGGGGGRQVQRSGGHFAPGRGQGGTGADPGGGQRGGARQPQVQPQHERQIATLTQELQQLRQKSQGDGQILDRLRQAFAPEDGGKGAADPRKNIEAQLDYYLSEAVEAEKAGTPIPLTTNLAAHVFQSELKRLDQQAEYETRIAQLEEGLRTQQDPQATINRGAFSQLDNTIKRGLDSLYGRGQESLARKSALFRSVGESIQGEIQHLSTTNFAQWDAIRRDPQMLQEMAERHLAQLIPPQARAMLEQQRLADTPMKTSELREALREAQQIKDPAKRSELCASIRRDMWEAMFHSGKLRLRE